jgi:hypothetical protein
MRAGHAQVVALLQCHGTVYRVCSDTAFKHAATVSVDTTPTHPQPRATTKACRLTLRARFCRAQGRSGSVEDADRGTEGTDRER